MTSTAKTYRIPAENFHAFKLDMATLAKRAAKIGVPAPSYTEVGTEETVTDGFVDVVHLVTVEGEAPCFAGWSMVAVIEIDPEVDPDAPNVVHVLGVEKNPEWTTMESRCDHCRANIASRRKLMVVDHEDGARKVVGSTCLRDFLGHEAPESIAAWAELILSLDERIDEYEERSSGGGERRYDPVYFLAFAVRSVAERGYHKSNSDFSTRDHAMAMMTAKSIDVERPTADEEAEAAAAIAWGKAQTLHRSDYIDNVVAVCSKTGWLYKDLGIGVSVVSAYYRAMERETVRKIQAAATAGSVHVGTVGKRSEFGPLTVTGRMAFESDYGVKWLVKMLDTDGNVVTWWASTANHPEPGQVVTGKATVKAHDMYQDVAQTTITRFAWAAVETESVAA